jgi:thymidylate synthase (FAD)
VEHAEVTFRSDTEVEMVDSMGGDDGILRAMMVSTNKDQAVAQMSDEEKIGKINFLMKNRHGTPFEHCTLQFRAEVPIFVMREWHRHRIGVSYNEMSGRYTQLPPMYYIPPPHRPLVQVGKPGHYTYVPGTEEQYEALVDDMRIEAIDNYARYERRLDAGIAKEVARMSLGLNIFTAQYYTCNPRSLMAFLSLRTKADPYWWPVEQDEDGLDLFRATPGGSMFPSFPMWEIEQVADDMENMFAEHFPITWAAFTDNGRVCP